MLLDDIAGKLEEAGIGTIGTNIFKGELPDQPDNCIALFEYAGSPPELTHDGKEIERPGLQVRVRNKGYAAGRAKAESVILELQGLSNVTLGTTIYLSIRVNHSPAGIGRDTNNRAGWTVNFSVFKARG